MNRVRDIRKARGWTQRELAEASGLPRPHIGAIERGHMRPRIDTARKVADALDVTLDALWPRADSVPRRWLREATNAR